MHKDLVNVTQQHQQQMIATISYKYDTAIQQRGVGQAYPEREPETNNIEKKNETYKILYAAYKYVIPRYSFEALFAKKYPLPMLRRNFLGAFLDLSCGVFCF